MAIDSGADLVIGHHPHVLQALRHIKAGLSSTAWGISYSTGRYLKETDETVILSVEASAQGIGRRS